MSASQLVSYATRAAGKVTVAVLTIRNPPVNALSHGVRKGLIESLERAVSDASVSAVVVSGEGKMFSAGADISEFTGADVMRVPMLPEVIAALERSPKPVIAAINGTAFGGGLEVALGCHYRIARNSAKVGLPEVELGILPGAGGTQRLPRLAGVDVAVDMIVSGRPVPAAKALEAGIVDKVVPDGDCVVSRAVEFAAQSAGLRPRRTSEIPVKGDRAAQDAAIERANKGVSRLPKEMVAQRKCVEAVRASFAAPSFEAGMKAEQDLIRWLMAQTQARAQQHLFFAERLCAKIPGLDAKAARDVKSAGVVGSGTMGTGIAICFAQAGIPVTVVDSSEEALRRSVDNVRRTFADAVKKGRMDAAKAEKIGALVSTTTDLTRLSNADIVIEAVFESMPVKRDVFGRLDAICKRDALLCTNTSTLSVDEIASATSRPESVIGTHFFSPANVMRLLENVKGARSSDAAKATAMRLGQQLGKVAVLVGNCDGFVGNRMLHPYSEEAVFMLAEGALPSQIDRAMTAFGFPMGIFAVGDLSGNDIGYSIRKGKGLVDPATRPRDLRYCAIADELCAQGRFGQKTGKGWYLYEKGSRTPTEDPAVTRVIEEYSRRNGIQRRSISDEEIVERCMFSLINEGFKVLEEGIAIRPSDIDIVWCYGYGFPRFRGGPMFYADTVGLRRVYERVCYYSRQIPNARYWKPSPLLEKLATSGKSLADYAKESAKSKL